MECACTVPMCIDDCVDLLFFAFVKAHKVLRCNECDRRILEDEEYFKEIINYEGCRDVHRTCDDCYSLRQVFFSDGWYYGSIREHLVEMIQECQGEISVSCINMLTKRAKDWVLDEVIEEVYDCLNEEEGLNE